jgi:hypothetical protein
MDFPLGCDLQHRLPGRAEPLPDKRVYAPVVGELYADANFVLLPGGWNDPLRRFGFGKQSA